MQRNTNAKTEIEDVKWDAELNLRTPSTMDEQERQACYKSETDDLYRAVGRFVVHFEHLCHAMSFAVLFAFDTNGLRTQKLGQAVLADLTADPLRKIFLAVYAELTKDKEDHRILTALNARIQKLIEHRNNVVHRTWMIGWASSTDTDFSKAGSHKTINTMNGPQERPLDYEVADFEKLTAESETLKQFVFLALSCTLDKEPLKGCFTFDAAGNLKSVNG